MGTREEDSRRERPRETHVAWRFFGRWRGERRRVTRKCVGCCSDVAGDREGVDVDAGEVEVDERGLVRETKAEGDGRRRREEGRDWGSFM